MRLLIVGAGSTGGYFGARLAQAGRDVTFLVRPGRAAQLAKDDLRVTSPRGDIRLRPCVVTADSLDGNYDMVLLTVKGFQLESALEDVAPAISAETMILPVLNGMCHMNIIAARFSAKNIIGCAVKVATMLEDDGSIVQLSALQDFGYGEIDGSATPRILALNEFMKDADIGARLSTFIYRDMWEKWILLASMGAITCMMRGAIGEVEASPGGKVFALTLLQEVVAIVKEIGVPPSEAFLQITEKQLTAKGSPLASSMFRDVQRGRAIEVESIIGDLVERGNKIGVTSPLLSAAYTCLSLYRRKLARIEEGIA